AIIDELDPVARRQAAPRVPAEARDLDGERRGARRLRRLDDLERHAAVVAVPLERRAVPAVVDLNPVELVLLTSQARVGGRQAGILILLAALRPRLDLRQRAPEATLQDRRRLARDIGPGRVARRGGARRRGVGRRRGGVRDRIEERRPVLLLRRRI